MPTYLETAPEEWQEEAHELASDALVAGSQGVEANAKDDTLYYGAGANIAALATDLSQYGDNQTTAATWHYEAAPATRFDVASSWAIEVDVDMSNTSTGYFYHYSSGANQLALSLDGAGSVQARLAGAVVGTLALPSASGSTENYVVAWDSQPNPYTTGASNAMRSELRAWNVTQGTYAQLVFTHAIRATTTGDQIWWASTTAGATPFSGTPNACRFSSNRDHPSTETKQDFVGLTPAPVLQLATRCEYPIVDPSCTLGTAGQLVGPVHFMGAQSVDANAFRAFSPIVNENYLNRLTIVADNYSEIPTQYRAGDHGAAYTHLGPWTFYRPVPPSATHLRVRMFIKLWDSGIGNRSALLLRMYSHNRPHVSSGAVVDQDAALVSTYASGILDEEHGSAGTDGAWVDLGLVVPSLNSAGCTWLELAVDTLGGTPSATSFEIGAIVIEPGVIE